MDPLWLRAPALRTRHEQLRTKIALAINRVEVAIQDKVPSGVVVCDAWHLVEDLDQVLARRRTAWLSVLKTNRLRQTASLQLGAANGWALKLPGPHIAVEGLVRLIPALA